MTRCEWGKNAEIAGREGVVGVFGGGGGARTHKSVLVGCWWLSASLCVSLSAALSRAHARERDIGRDHGASGARCVCVWRALVGRMGGVCAAIGAKSAAKAASARPSRGFRARAALPPYHLSLSCTPPPPFAPPPLPQSRAGAMRARSRGDRERAAVCCCSSSSSRGFRRRRGGVLGERGGQGGGGRGKRERERERESKTPVRVSGRFAAAPSPTSAWRRARRAQAAAR
jgi:hypothetical protein